MKKIILSIAMLLAPVLTFAQSESQVSVDAPGLTVEAKPQLTLGDKYYTYEFGFQYLYSTSYMDLTLTASGNVPTEIYAINWTGSSYDVYSNCPTILPPGRQCTTRVVFHPRWVGHHYSDVIFRLNSGNIIVRYHGWVR